LYPSIISTILLAITSFIFGQLLLVQLLMVLMFVSFMVTFVPTHSINSIVSILLVFHNTRLISRTYDIESVLTWDRIKTLEVILVHCFSMVGVIFEIRCCLLFLRIKCVTFIIIILTILMSGVIIILIRVILLFRKIMILILLTNFPIIQIII